MSGLIDGTALLRVAGISLLASVGTVFLFAVAVASLDLAGGDRPDGEAPSHLRLLGRSGAAVALALCVAALVAGLWIMLES